MNNYQPKPESDSTELSLFAKLNQAGTYKGKQITKKSREKAWLKRQRKKGKSVPQVSKDTEARKSVAKELMRKISGGENFMANLTPNNKERNNVVGDAFQINGKSFNDSYLTQSIKQPSLVKCIKEIGIDTDGVKVLTKEYDILRGRISNFHADQIPTLEEYLQMANTLGVVVMTFKTTKSFKVKIEVKDESGETKTVTRNYKDKRDKFPRMGAFSHALNQFGRYENLDLGISVEPIWVDYTGLGIVDANDVEIVAQKIMMLYELAGFNQDYGLVCEHGCNADIMTSSQENVTIEDENFTQYRQFFKFINMAEFVFSSCIKREPIKKLKPLSNNEYEALPSTRYTELYKCAYDRGLLIEKYLQFFMTSLNRS